MAPFNFMLTKADFDARQWEEVLAACKEPTCSAFCGALKVKLDEAKTQSDAQRRARLCAASRRQFALP